jgi:serine/threonine protein kinase
MWSLGCIVVELFLGLPLFPGSSEYNQVSRIVEMLGMPPQWMLEMGKQSGEFFEKTTDEFGRRIYRLKSMEQYSREHNVKEQPSKKYFQATTLPEIIRSYAMPRKNMKQAEIERGKIMCFSIMQSLIFLRNEQQNSFYRFCSRSIDNESFGTLVTPAGEITPFYYPAEVHPTIRASHEPQISVIKQDPGSWGTTATTSRGSQQTKASTSGPGAGTSSAGAASSNGSSERLHDANESIPTTTTSTNV